jgi:hypothetical protein
MHNICTEMNLYEMTSVESVKIHVHFHLYSQRMINKNVPP